MSAPPFQATLLRCDAWRWALGCLAGAAVAASVAWLVALPRPWAGVPWLLAIAGGAGAVWLAIGLAAVPAWRIRWDGQSWFLHLADDQDLPTPGTMAVALDVGPWMLLRFLPAAGRGRARPIWLPLQRAGLESTWHALRCAAYAPRPALQPAEPP